MSRFENALSSYFTSTRHSASIGREASKNHSRRMNLLRSGKTRQAAALRQAAKHPVDKAGR